MNGLVKFGMNFEVALAMDMAVRKEAPGCAAVGSRIHCYGGGKSSDINVPFILDDHYSLDYEASFIPNQPLEGWSKELSIPIEQKRWGHDLVSISKNAMVLIQGSDNGNGSSQIQNITSVYYHNNQSWATIPTDKSLIPDAFASSAEVDSHGNVYVWGGLVATDNLPPLFEFYNDHANESRAMLPNFLYILNTITWTWSVSPVNGNSSSNVIPIRADHSSAMSDDNKLYIVGGITIASGGDALNGTNNTRLYCSMANIIIYDTERHSWSSVTAAGKIPSMRRAATLTNIPKESGQENFLVLYGGIYDNGSRNARKSAEDTCYTLNLTNLTWSEINLEVNQGNVIGSGQLYGHNAVLVKKKYLFILFGVDELKGYRGDVNILDVTTWQWLSSYNVVNIWTPGMIAGVVLAVAVVAEFRAIEEKAANGRNNDFVVDPPDPRTTMEDHAYHPSRCPSPGEKAEIIDPSSPTLIARPMSSGPYYLSPPHSPDDSALDRQQWLSDRPQSTPALGLMRQSSYSIIRPSSSALSQSVTESTFTSFSGTTKPDETPLPTPALQKVKPDGDA
ncbi:hypothetical protein DM01DRAFT_312934 [Hesseltinella vesiculosa]|uniref:Galactose oxidase n=1 Tax=Hesseltinella vesiculosa TaxID=101127 RepID=A0A1X2GYL0_9FUNG|nr:hypothetical protein DM01DRAFT_312934 [Hesseltinella vesiculosa]